jgi:hypothetical protein
MRRIPALIPVAAIALGLAAAAGGCANAPSKSAQATAAMWAAAASAAPQAPVLPAGAAWVGSRAEGVQVALPDSWVSVSITGMPRSVAISKLGLAGASSSALPQLAPSLAHPAAVDVADPGSGTGQASQFQANVSAYCTESHFPPGTNPVTGLTTAAELELSAVNANNAQITQTRIDGKPALLIDYDLSVGQSTLTGLQYAIAPSAGRACYVTMTTRKPVIYEPVFSRLRTAIRFT